MTFSTTSKFPITTYKVTHGGVTNRNKSKDISKTGDQSRLEYHLSTSQFGYLITKNRSPKETKGRLEVSITNEKKQFSMTRSISTLYPKSPNMNNNPGNTAQNVRDSSIAVNVETTTPNLYPSMLVSKTSGNIATKDNFVHSIQNQSLKSPPGKCTCFCSKLKNDINSVIANIKVDKRNTKMFKRKFLSAGDDNRTSSKVIGVTGIFICIFPFILAMYIDICTFLA